LADKDGDSHHEDVSLDGNLTNLSGERDSYLSINFLLSIGYVLKLKKYPQIYPLQGDAMAML
jgi:hypothetical protein